MSEFDDFDLGRRLRDAAGSDPDLTAARDMVQRRVVRARRRRTSAISGAAAAVLVTIGLVAALGHEGDARIETSESVISVSETVPAPTTVVASSTTSTPTATTAPGATTLPSAPAPTVAPTLPPTQAPTSLPGQSPTEPTTTSETTATSTSVDAGTTVPEPADITQPFDSIGGSIVVRLSGGQMTLLSTSPSAGYGIERQIEKPDDIEVRFQSADAESRIRVRLVNGLMVADIDEQ